MKTDYTHMLYPSNLQYEAVPFDQIDEKDFLPALDEAITITENKIKTLITKFEAEKSVGFEVIESFEASTDEVDYLTGVFSSLRSAHCTDYIASIAEEYSAKITKLLNDINLNPLLFEIIKKVWDQKESLNLSKEQNRLLEKIYKTFTRNGALLSSEEKEELRKIDELLSKLSVQFSENTRNATNQFYLVIDNKDDLKGLPEDSIEQAVKDAQSRNLKDKWVFTLQRPSYLPFMQYCQNRELRKRLSAAFNSRATEGEFDNRKVAVQFISLSHKRAKLLGYNSYAHFALEMRMAKTPEAVMGLLNSLYEKSLPAAQKDLLKLKELKKELTGDEQFDRYDAPFYAEVLQKRELDFDSETLRPYFKLENVIEGIFQISNKLYNLTFKELKLPVYHPEVKVYEVKDLDGEYLGLFYADFFPRKEKKPGAWMTTFREQGMMFGESKRPFVSIVCNFTKPTDNKPSLLTLEEVQTLFHEFGHALHGLLSKCTYKGVAGTSVYWDFVELPSQIFENWVDQKEALDLFATHYKTGEKLSDSIIEKIRESRSFLEGLASLRQISFGMLDMSWYGAPIDDKTDVYKHENEAIAKYDPYPRDKTINVTCSFGHIFSGYSAGYYSYKWSEVLDADAFELFKEKGIFNKEVADSFRKNILEKGDSEDPMELYIRFRGREPMIEPLLRRSGLLEN